MSTRELCALYIEKIEIANNASNKFLTNVPNCLKAKNMFDVTP